MERRAFMKFLVAGAAALVADPSKALTFAAPLAPDAPKPAPQAAVATQADLEQAHVEKAQWYYRRRYWRPRRYWRRYYRPRYWRRRRYYYYYY